MKLVHHHPEGEPGTDDSPMNVLSRALHELIRLGRPQQAVCSCLYQPVEDGALARWFGLFVRTAGGQLLFFPGFFRRGRIGVKHRGSRVSERDFDIDHLTLEPDLKSWHITGPPRRGQRPHQRGPGTLDVGEGRVLWCGISLADEVLLPTVKRQTVVQAEVADSDSERRMSELVRLVEANPHGVVSLNPEGRARFDPGFLHFSFVVGPSGFPDYRDVFRGFPCGSEADCLPDLPEGASRSHPFRLNRVHVGVSVDVQITVSWLPGKLGRDVLLVSN